MSKTRISLALPIVAASALAWAVGCSSASNAAPNVSDAGAGADGSPRPVWDGGTEVDARSAGYTRIDDMEGTGIRVSWTAPPGTIPLWGPHAENAELGHLLSPDPSGAWSYAPVPAPYETFPGITSTHAARVRTLGPLVNTYGADMHIIFARPPDSGMGALPVRPGFGLGSADLSAYGGITFWGMGDPNQITTTVEVMIFETNTWPEAGLCVDNDGGTENCFNGFSATRTLTGSFERYTIDFAELAQNPSWGYQARAAADLKHVYILVFQVNTPSGASSTSSLTFDVWIDDLYFVNK